MTSTSERLQQYRQRKEEQQVKEARKELFWNTITLQPLRRRIVPDNHLGENSPGQEDGEEPEVKTPRTKLDWAIIFIKFLVWVCMQVTETFLPGLKILNFVSIQVIFVKIEFGAVFFLLSCILLMTSNLGKRKPGEASAYSVFNENCEAIDGTLTAQQFEREIRHGGPAAAN